MRLGTGKTVTLSSRPDFSLLHPGGVFSGMLLHGFDLEELVDLIVLPYGLSGNHDILENLRLLRPLRMRTRSIENCDGRRSF